MSVAGPTPKKRGPNNGERVGGVCPEQLLFAIRRVRSVSSRMIIAWRVGVKDGRNCVAKWVEGYPSSVEVRVQWTRSD